MPGRVTNIRPGLIVGQGDPTDRFTYWPIRVARGGEVLAPGSGKDPVQFIDVRDLAEWTIGCIERRHLGIYNATGPSKRMTVAELLDACKQASGSNATFTWVDAKFLEEQKVSPWSDLPVWTGGEDFATISNAKAIAAGLTFRPAAETAKATLDWFKTLPPERQAKLRSGLPAEREAELLTSWHSKQKQAAAEDRNSTLASSRGMRMDGGYRGGMLHSPTLPRESRP
jgi:2'-hydroxyisoflavone reductase